MKIHHLVLVAVLSVAATLGTVYGLGGLHSSNPAPKETLYDRVKRAGKIRCGYVIEPPLVMLDPNTGKLSGLTYELMEEIGRQLSLKIDWAGTVTYSHMVADLALNRFDMICSPVYTLPSRMREADYTVPFVFLPDYFYVRKDDTRFDNNYAAINDPGIRFSILDGHYSNIAASRDFPLATKISIPENASLSQLYLDVANNKADITVSDVMTFSNYDRNNPGKLRRVEGKPPLVGAGVFTIPAKEQDFKNALDVTIAYLLTIGTIDNLLRKYETPTLKFLNVARPYADPGVHP